MQFPTIHLNGTSRGALVDSYQDAIDAIREAQTKLAETAPNGRDYYLHGDSAIHAAIAEHTNRVAKLEHVRRELESILEAIC